MQPMQSEIPADRAPTSGRGVDPGRRAGAVPASQPPREGDRSGADRSGADLPESEQFFRATFERAVIGIAHVSPEGRVLRVNQRLCDLLGYSPEELAALTWQDLTHLDDRDAASTQARRLLAGAIEEYELDQRYLRKDGTPVWVHLAVALVRTPEGEPDYFITMAQAITVRKRLQEERAQALERERATNARLLALQALTDTALSHLGLDDLLRELLGRVTGVMGVDNVSMFLLEHDGRTLTLRAARGLEEEAVGRVQVAVGQTVPGRIAASRVPLIVNDLSASDLESVPAILRERVHARAGVPLLVQDQVEGKQMSRLVGVLTVSSATPSRFTDSDVQLLQRAADRIALAIDRALVYAAEQDARQRAEAALARALVSETQATDRAQRLYTILETIVDAVAVYDTAGRPIQSNRAYHELFALDRAPAAFESLPALDRAGLLQIRGSADATLPFEETPLGRALRGEVVRRPGEDCHVRAFDGRELEVNLSAAPLHEADGRVVGAVEVMRDMTERNRMEREHAAARADELGAREASRRMEAFLATAAHDLRSPLTATVGFLTLAQDKTEQLAAAVQEACPDLAPRVAAVRTRMEDADQSAERLTRLLTLLFDTAAIRADRLELHRASFDLVALVREQVAALRMAAPGRTIRLHAPVAPEDGGPVPVVPVEADADRLGQVVANYVTNALKYSPPDRPVDVFIEARRGRARVAVRDAGPGIPKGERTRVWELFHRAPGVTPQGGAQGGSLGLGLHITKAIIAAHGGHVGVESAVGKGSTFWFTLPLAHLARADARRSIPR